MDIRFLTTSGVAVGLLCALAPVASTAVLAPALAPAKAAPTVPAKVAPAGPMKVTPTVPAKVAPAASAAPAKLARPVVIAQEQLDVNGDRHPDSFTIQMIAGQRYLDQNDWCGNGDKYEGIFQTVIRIAPSKTAPDQKGKTKRIPGKTIVQNLNHLYGDKARPEMFFRAGRWRMIFGDYTHTGAMTFNLSQFRSCQGAGYKVFKIQPDGKIVSLHPTGLGFWVSDFANSSVELKLNAQGFCARTFDPEIGTGQLPGLENRCYAWNRSRLGFELVN